jgi:hypothetical protein
MSHMRFRKQYQTTTWISIAQLESGNRPRKISTPLQVPDNVLCRYFG